MYLIQDSNSLLRSLGSNSNIGPYLKKCFIDCQSSVNLLLLFFSCRVLTGPKTWAAAQTFVDAEANSVWDLIYKKQMTDDSFAKSGTAAIESLLKSNELFTGYGYVEALIYSSKPCQLKVVWKSPGKNL